jgi:glucose-6-phosphate 1-dehydrogenase
MPAPASESVEKPERNPLRCEIPADPCAIVIFGASGDLTKRKLIPALFDLATNNCLAPRFAIVGVARTPMSDEAFRGICGEAVKEASEGGGTHPSQISEFTKNVSYVAANYAHDDAYKGLAQRLDELDKQRGLQGNRLFYLATPPTVYAQIVLRLSEAGLARPPRDHSWARIIIEKPFGSDRESAAKLNQTVLDVFSEKQVYRIDHYLGKETVQNLLVFRFGNGIFEPLWNRNYVDHVQITAAETLGVEHRAEFYDNTGALRDMIQSHMLQLASMVAMEPPATFDATAVRNEKLKVLQSIRPRSPEEIQRDVVRGQYGPGKSEGKDVPGYRAEPDVRNESATETFVAGKFEIDNWRWAGVPFYARTGKRLPRRVTEIAIQFRRAPHIVFREKNVEPNWLVLNIQPDEGITLSFSAKLPGPEMLIKNVAMDFCYREAFGAGSPSAYSTLINDCMRGDATLFDRGDSVEAAWALVDPILDYWKNAPAPRFPNYAAGTWGPREADELLEKDGRHWRTS